MAVRRSLAARRPPPTASAFAWRLGFCDSPSSPGRGRVMGISWERGRPARIRLFLMVVAELPRGFAGSHYVGSKPQRPGRRRARAPLPVDPGGGDARAGSLRPHIRPGTWFTSFPGIGQEAWFSAQESLPPRRGESAAWKWIAITPPLRGSRREGGARSRAGGGQTRRPVSDHQRHGQRRVGGGACRFCGNGMIG